MLETDEMNKFEVSIYFCHVSVSVHIYIYTRERERERESERENETESPQLHGGGSEVVIGW